MKRDTLADIVNVSLIYWGNFMKLSKDDIILFNGDSITDALRDRSDKYSLAGYSKLISEEIANRYPLAGIQCYNRGIGGDTSAQLLARLKGELEEIRPTVFSLLIGVNDTWRRFDSGTPIGCRTYEKNVDEILCMAEAYTRRIIVMQPFLLDVDRKKRKFRKDLDSKIRALERTVRKHGCEYVPLDGMFAEASCKRAPSELSYDGVHPTQAGHALIAEEWLKRVEFDFENGGKI